MKKILTTIMVLGILTWASPGAAEEGQVFDRATIKVNYWTADYSGDIELEEVDAFGGTGMLIGEEIDIEDEFGIKTPEGIPEIEAEVRLGKRHRLLAGYFATEYTGKNQIDTNIDFAGYSFVANSTLRTEFKSERYKFMYEFRPLQRDNMSLGIMAGVEYFNLVIDYQGTANNLGVPVRIEDNQKLPAPIPVAGIRARINNENGLGLYCDFAGVGASVEDVDASYMDLDAGIYYDYKRLHTGLGYRMLDSRLDAELDDNEELSVHNITQGWLVSAGINF